MKYLKHFESFENNEEDHIQMVKDVFQDLIDEWDMEVLTGRDDYSEIGNYIRIDVDDKNIMINIFKYTGHSYTYVSDSPEFKSDIEGHIRRFKNMGYGDIIEGKVKDYNSIRIKLI